MIKEILENKITVPNIPRGYRHFSKPRQLRELDGVLNGLKDETDNPLFSKKEIADSQTNKNIVFRKIYKLKNRELDKYLGYVYNFGLDDDNNDNNDKAVPYYMRHY